MTERMTWCLRIAMAITFPTFVLLTVPPAWGGPVAGAYADITLTQEQIDSILTPAENPAAAVEHYNYPGVFGLAVDVTRLPHLVRTVKSDPLPVIGEILVKAAVSYGVYEGVVWIKEALEDARDTKAVASASPPAAIRTGSVALGEVTPSGRDSTTVVLSDIHAPVNITITQPGAVE